MADIVIETIDDLEEFVNGDLGMGTSESPLEVVLANDLDFSELNDSDSRKWNFNGSASNLTFYANIDGQGYSIKNLSYNGSATWRLIQTLNGAIRNLTLQDANIQTSDTAYLFNSITDAENVHFRGFLKGLHCGLFGGMTAQNRTVDRCTMSGVFTGRFRGVLGAGGSSTYNYPLSRSWVKGDIYTTGIDTSLLANNAKCRNCFFIGNIYSSVSSGTVNVKWSQVGTTQQYCYAIILNQADLVGKITSQAFFNGAPTASYWSYDLESGELWTDTSNATTSENLRNAVWLRAKGWPI